MLYFPRFVGGSLVTEIIESRAGEVGNHFGRAETGVLAGHAAEPALRKLVIGEGSANVAAGGAGPRGGGIVNRDRRAGRVRPSSEVALVHGRERDRVERRLVPR